MKQLFLLIAILATFTTSAQVVTRTYNNATGNESGCCLCNWQQVVNNGNSINGDPGNTNYVVMHQSSTLPGNAGVFGHDGLAIWYNGMKILDMGYEPALPGEAYLHIYNPAGTDTAVMAEGLDASIRLSNRVTPNSFKSIIRSGAVSAYREFTTDDRSGQFALAGDGVNPAVVYGPAVGAVGATGIVGDDRSGIISFTTGAGAISGLMFTVTFSQVFTTPVRVVCFPANNATAGFFYGRSMWTNSSFTTHFDLNTFLGSPALPAGIAMQIGYIVQK
jgi:hypothetical protein